MLRVIRNASLFSISAKIVLSVVNMANFGKVIFRIFGLETTNATWGFIILFISMDIIDVLQAEAILSCIVNAFARTY